MKLQGADLRSNRSCIVASPHMFIYKKSDGMTVCVHERKHVFMCKENHEVMHHGAL